MEIFTSYLAERKQYVVVESFPSSQLAVGSRSVTQGSTLSSILYIIYILDITSIYKNIPHNPKEYSKCSETNAKSFVDDNILHTKTRPDRTIQQEVLDTIAKI